MSRVAGGLVSSTHQLSACLVSQGEVLGSGRLLVPLLHLEAKIRDKGNGRVGEEGGE